MTTKRNTLIIGIAVILSGMILFFGLHRKKKEKVTSFSYHIFYQPTGWGYEVLVNNKIYIHQDFVPVLSAQKGFNRKEYAEKAAQMVVEKMQHNQLPTLTASDMQAIAPSDSLVYTAAPIK